MAIVIRKNGGLNQALGGLREGIQTGFGMGQSMRSQQRADRAQALDERNSATRRLAIEAEAQRAAQQWAQEQSQLQAAQEAVAAPALPPAQMGLNPVANVHRLGRYGQAIQQHQEIAKRMDPKLAMEWLAGKKDELKKKAMEDADKQFNEKVANDIANKKWWLRDPKTGDLVQNPDLEKQVGQIAQRGGDPRQKAIDYARLKSSVVASEAQQVTREHTSLKLREELETIKQNSFSMPGSSDQMKVQRMEGLLKAYEIDSDTIDPKDWNRQWDAAKRGFQWIGNDPVPFGEEQSYFQRQQQAEQTSIRAKQAETEVDRLRGILLQSQSKYYDEQASLKGRTEPKDPNAPPPEKPMSRLDARKQAIDELKAMTDDEGNKVPVTEARIEAKVKELSRSGEEVAGIEDRKSKLSVLLHQIEQNPYWRGLSEEEQNRRLADWVESNADPLPGGRTPAPPEMQPPR